MNVAKSLYLGGKIIYANDKRLNYYSYKELGLRCRVCGEPVHLRSGNYRQPHFAHFKGTDPRQVEECNLRASAYGNSLQGSESKFIEDKGQKIEIFQNNFLNIIASRESNFYNGINFLKAPLVPENLLPFAKKNLENNISKCIEWFLEDSVKSKNYIKAFHRYFYKNNSSTDSFTLREEVICEVFDYLQKKSSRHLLETLIHYSIYKGWTKLLKTGNNSHKTLYMFDITVETVKSELIGIIIHTPWLEAFFQINGLEKPVNLPHKEANKGSKHISYFQGKTDTDPEISCLYRNVECRIRLNDIRKNNLLCWVEYRLLDGSVARDTWFMLGTINLQKSKKGNTFLGFNDTKNKPFQEIVNAVDNGKKLNNLLTALTGLIGQATIGMLHPKSDSRWINPHWQKKVLRCTLKRLASSAITIDDDRRCTTARQHKYKYIVK